MTSATTSSERPAASRRARLSPGGGNARRARISFCRVVALIISKQFANCLDFRQDLLRGEEKDRTVRDQPLPGGLTPEERDELMEIARLARELASPPAEEWPLEIQELVRIAQNVPGTPIVRLWNRGRNDPDEVVGRFGALFTVAVRGSEAAWTVSGFLTRSQDGHLLIEQATVEPLARGSGVAYERSGERSLFQRSGQLC